MPHAAQINRRALGAIPKGEYPIANASDAWLDRGVFLMWAGAYGDNRVYVFADSFDDAWEQMVEFFDKPDTCGIFSFPDEGDVKAAAEDIGVHWPTELEMHAEKVTRAFDALDEDDQQRVIEQVEVDMTSIGHTTLECMPEGAFGAYIPSWEWGGDEVHGAERDLVKAAALSEGDAEELKENDFKLVASRNAWVRIDGEMRAEIEDHAQFYASAGKLGVRVFVWNRNFDSNRAPDVTEVTDDVSDALRVVEDAESDG